MIVQYIVKIGACTDFLLVRKNVMGDRILSLFIDESGDFGAYDVHTSYYIVAMILHDQDNAVNTGVIIEQYNKSCCTHVRVQQLFCYHALQKKSMLGSLFCFLPFFVK